MDRASDELFAGTAFPGDQDGGIGRRNELNLLHHLSQAGTSPDDVAEVLFGANFVEQVSVLSLEPRLLLFHQHLIGDVHEHAARIPACRLRPAPPPHPQRPAVVLAAEFEDHSLFVGSGGKQRERIAQAALSFGRIREKRGPEQTLYFVRLDAQDLHRSAVGPKNTGVDSLMDVRDGCFLKKVTEAFLALS